MSCKLLLPGLLVLVTACTANPQQANYYLLSDTTDAMSRVSTAQPSVTITLNRLTLASYLNQSALAFLQGSHQLVYANQHLWAERLQDGVQRVLVDDFNQLGVQRLVLADEPAAGGSDYQLQLQIDQFLPSDAGEVLLSGHYWLMQGGKLLRQQGFAMREPLLEDGYRHSVAVQRQLLSQLATLLSEAVQQTVGDPDTATQQR
jgi:uncharacterized lipoprotein YmbA